MSEHVKVIVVDANVGALSRMELVGVTAKAAVELAVSMGAEGLTRLQVHEVDARRDGRLLIALRGERADGAPDRG